MAQPPYDEDELNPPEYTPPPAPEPLTPGQRVGDVPRAPNSPRDMVYRPARVDENGVPTFDNSSIPQKTVTTPATTTEQYTKKLDDITHYGSPGAFIPDQQLRRFVTGQNSSQSGRGGRDRSSSTNFGVFPDGGLTGDRRLQGLEEHKRFQKEIADSAYLAKRADMERTAAERSKYLTDLAAHNQAKYNKGVLDYEMARTNTYTGQVYLPHETAINNPLFVAGERDAPPLNQVYKGPDSEWDRQQADFSAAMNIPGHEIDAKPGVPIGSRERLGDVFNNADKYPSPQAQYERIMRGPGATAMPQTRAIWEEQGAKLKARMDEATAPYVGAVESFFIDSLGSDTPVTEEQKASIRQMALSGINEQTVGDIFNPKISPFNYAANLAIRQGLGDGSIRPATPFFDPSPEAFPRDGNWMVVKDHATDRGRADNVLNPDPVRRAGNVFGNFLANFGLDTGLTDDKVAVVNSANPGQVIMVPRSSFPTNGLPQVTSARLREVANGVPFRDDEITIPDMGQRALSSAISSGQGVSSTPDVPLNPPVMPEQGPVTAPAPVEQPTAPEPAPGNTEALVRDLQNARAQAPPAQAPPPPVQPVAQAAPAAEDAAATQFAAITDPWEAPVSTWRASDDGSATEQGMAQQARIAQAMKQAYQEGDMEWLARLQSIYSPDQWTAQV